MIFGVAIIALLLPLIITPGVFFAFDITPKIALLVLGTCVMLCFANENIKRIQGMAGTSCGRWFLGLLALQWISLVVASGLSVSRGLSLHGSGWRRYGLLTQTCVLLMGLLAGAWISEHRPRIQSILRMFTGTGAVGATYGIFQYFGWDPLLSVKSYQAGEDASMIVRPPGTLGHADYFAAWLVAVFFAALALAPREKPGRARVFACAIAVLAVVATLLSGTRSALLGLAVGMVVYVLVRRPRITRRSLALAAVGVACLALFFVSPAGTKLRARVHWSTEDIRGGARLLLWRDSLTMAAQRPWIGFGLETFSVEFPQFQSLELARAYPDFYHESPHNVFLDAFTAQGATGLLTLLALAIFGFYVSTRLDREQRAPLVAGWAGLLVCHQFVVFIAPTAAYFYLWLAMLTGSATELDSSDVLPAPRRAWPVCAVAVLTGLVLTIYATRLMVADAALATVRRALESGQIEQAAHAYQTVLAWQPDGAGSDLYYSRGMAEARPHATLPSSRFLAWSQAVESGKRAASSAEDRPNACYSLAGLMAAQNDSAGAEQSLRNAIAAAPNWYKPHWTLARLLSLTGRDAEALAEASAAVERGGGRHAEVLDTLIQLTRNNTEKR